jgi:serine/threonine-protein kinase
MPERKSVDSADISRGEAELSRETAPWPSEQSGERSGREPEMAAPSTIGGRYLILGFLGRGGMGSVYRVRDLVLDETVALKFLRRDLVRDPAMLARFKREVRVARRVTHANVARTFDIGTHEDGAFLTMEYIDGEPLSVLLSISGALSPQRVAEIGVAICAGLEAAHKAEVIHRDLKPDNVMVEKSGRVVLTDFGIARAVAGAGPLETSGIAGTPAYMAPEQVEGRSDIDARADLYALGAVLYELATGARAWPGEVALAVASARLVSPPPDPCARSARVPRALGDVILRCLARSPADRFRSAAEVAAALTATIGEGVSPTAPTAPNLASIPAPPPAPGTQAAPSPAPSDKTIAVLPFRNAGAADDAYIAEELTEDLVDTLSTTRGLKVRPHGMVMHMAHKAKDGGNPQDLGRALDVEVVVDGSVRRAGDGARIAVRLISVTEGFQVWAQRFERPARDLLVVSDEVAHAIAEALRVNVAAAPRAAAPDTDAVELYLRARHALRQAWTGFGDLREAVALFERGLARAPDDPGLLSGYAMARARMLNYTREAEGEPEHTRAVVDRAVAAAPHLGEPWLARATLFHVTGDWASAVTALRAAIARAPLLLKAREMLGIIQTEIGRVDDGLATLESVHALDPSAVSVRWELCRAHGLANHFDRAEALLALPVELPSDELNRILAQSRMNAWRGEPRAPVLPPHLAAGTGLATPLLRLYAEAARGAPFSDRLTAELEGLREAARRGSRLRPLLSQCAAELFAWAGDVERALRCASQAIDDGLFDLAWLDRCPVLAPLRADGRFPALRARLADVVRPIALALDAPRA